MNQQFLLARRYFPVITRRRSDSQVRVDTARTRAYRVGPIHWDQDQEDEDDEQGTASASATFDDQTTDGNAVTVQSATLSDGGFIAIHDSSLLEGQVLGSVIGVSDPLDAGTHEDIEVALFEGVPDQVFDQDALEDDQTLIAMPHFDTDGDGRYDFVCSEGEKDGPYTADGEAVVDDAMVTVEA